MERDDAAVLRELLQFIYSSHWGRYRGLVAVVSRRLDVPAEHLETEIAECEAALSRFISADESARTAALLEERRSELGQLLAEWEDVAQAIESES